LASLPAGAKPQRHGWDIAAAVLLLIAAYLLLRASSHYTPYGSPFRYRFNYYNSYQYYERLRIIVCGSWILAAIRFYEFRWAPVTILGLIIAWLFNPIVPVTMRRFQWQPYDHWTMILSVAAAVALLALSYKNRKPLSP
jgi:hypothetical protein